MGRNTEYQFINTDVSSLVAKLVTAYEKITEIVVRPASPEKLFIMWIADIIVQERALNNYTANQNLPSRAEGESLDALGQLFYNEDRPAAQAAICTERFKITAVQTTATLIPSGTLVTDTGQTLIWATTADIYIPIGELYVDVMIQCQTAGAIGNGFEVGQINIIITPFDLFDSCENMTASDGGTDAGTDDEYYELMRASQDGYSTAGPMGAYIYLAKSVSTEIADVKAIRPIVNRGKTLTIYGGRAFIGGADLVEDSLVVYQHGGITPTVEHTDYTFTYVDDLLTIEILGGGVLVGKTNLDITIDEVKAGYVNIYALMQDGSIASPTMKMLIVAACNDRDARPLTDKVSVEDADIVIYNIDFTFYIPRNATLSSSEIEAAVQKAVNEYTAWQSGKLGRDINPAQLISLLMATGIKRPVLTAPVFTQLSDGSDHTVPQIAQVGTITITNGGYEDE